LIRYGAYWPRQIGYILIGGYGYIKTDPFFDRVIYVLERGRRDRRVVKFPDGTERSWWDAVADGRTPDPLAPIAYDSPSAFFRRIREVAEKYAKHLQTGQQVVVEIMVETVSLSFQLAGSAHPFGVIVYPSGGETAPLPRLYAAVRVAERAKNGIQILHIGDFDGKGVAIYRVVQADVVAFARDLGADGMVTVERLAVTSEQVDRYNLDRDPVKLPKKHNDGTQPKNPGPPLPFNCQAEALNPEQLAEAVSTRIKKIQNRRVLAVTQSESKAERQIVLDLIDSVRTT
jgi:hypothetical protein